MVRKMIVANPKAGTSHQTNFGDPGSLVSVLTDEHSVL